MVEKVDFDSEMEVGQVSDMEETLRLVIGRLKWGIDVFVAADEEGLTVDEGTVNRVGEVFGLPIDAVGTDKTG